MLRDLIGSDPLPKNLEWLERTIDEWLEINCRYADVAKGQDTLYWYNERANIGALAGAAWKAGICAIEEYAALKKPKSATSKGSGRIDLYLTDESQDAIVEAKICWVAPGTEPMKLRVKMREACADARRDHDGDQKIGAVFYVMRVHQERVHEKTLIEEVERIRKTKPDALAWCFPAAVRNLQSERPEHKGYVWPGVIIALKVAKV